MMPRRVRRTGLNLRHTMATLIMVAGALVMLTPLIADQLAMWKQRRLVSEVELLRPVVSAPEGEATAAAPSAAPGESEPAQSAPEPAAPPTAPQTVPAAVPVGLAGYVLEIPSLDLRYAVTADIDDRHLARGPGQYPSTPLPGASGNTAIAGHRTIKGRPAFFYALDKLKVGDPITVTYPDRRFQYEVERVYLTTPYDLTVLAQTPQGSLTLTTCDPPGSDERRLIVRARLIQTQPATPNG